MSVTIARAKIQDTKAIRALESNVWNEQNVSGKYEIGVIIRFGHVFVAKDKGKIVGAILATKTVNDEIYVEDWFVDKNYRGKGIGKKLYARLMQAAKGLSLVSFIHPDFRESLAAHQKLGFKVVKKVKDVYGLGDRGSRFFVRKA